jgi:hypothetical protein
VLQSLLEVLEVQSPLVLLQRLVLQSLLEVQLLLVLQSLLEVQSPLVLLQHLVLQSLLEVQ